MYSIFTFFANIADFLSFEFFTIRCSFVVWLNFDKMRQNVFCESESSHVKFLTDTVATACCVWKVSFRLTSHKAEIYSRTEQRDQSQLRNHYSAFFSAIVIGCAFPFRCKFPLYGTPALAGFSKHLIDDCPIRDALSFRIVLPSPWLSLVNDNNNR